MTHRSTLTVLSLTGILLVSLHFSDDIVRGMEPGDLSTLGGVLILAVWSYATLVLAGRPLGLVIILLGSLGAAAIRVIHMGGAGLVGGRVANSSGIFFWVWTLVALGVTGIVTAILSAHELWARRRRGSPNS